MPTALVLLVLSADPTGTIEGTITVKAAGKPVSARNAFVYVDGYQTEAPKGRVTVKQANRTFTPAVAGLVRGQQVEFLNDEPVEDIYHHVFTPVKPPVGFSSKLFKAHAPPWVPPTGLTRLGRYDVFCDIHKNMYATLWVVPNDRFAVVAEDAEVGRFQIAGVKPGAWKLVGWHRVAEKQVEVPVTVEAGKTAKVELVIEGQSGVEALIANHKHKDGKAYEQLPDGGFKGEQTGAW